MRLTPAQVAEIRRLYLARVSMAKIAQIVGVRYWRVQGAVARYRSTARGVEEPRP